MLTSNPETRGNKKESLQPTGTPRKEGYAKE